MTKQVTFTPSPRPRDPAENWVTARETPEPRKPTRRFTFDLDADVHLRMKLDCAKRGVNMADEIRRILATQYPEEPK